MKRWCSIVSALAQRVHVMRRSSYGELPFRVEKREDIKDGCPRQLGSKEVELMPRHERWLRSSFSEDYSKLWRFCPAWRGHRAFDDFCEHHIASQSETHLNKSNEVECVRCGCSKEFDTYGDRICWCDSCFKGCKHVTSTGLAQTCLQRLPQRRMEGGRLQVADSTGPLGCWELLVASVLEVPCACSGSSCVSRKQLKGTRLQPSAIDIRRWARLHDLKAEQAAATGQMRALLLREPPPHQLTLSYQHTHMVVVESKRWEKRMRSRWNRMFLALLAAHCCRTRHDALHEVPALRAARSNGAGLRSAGSDAFTASSPHGRYERGTEDDALLAAQLGLDMATYRLLRQLEEREIMPEDYDLLGRLDEIVKPKTLNHEDVHRFKIVTYTSPSMTADMPSTEFGLDYWRLPVPILASETAGDNCLIYCFGVDFWKLPMATLPEDRCEDVSSLRSFDVCGVCLIDFDDGDELRVLPCGHHFHRECIDHWLLTSSTVCPVDKQDLQHED